MIGRVRGRRSFDALQQQGRRSRVGPLAITFLSDASDRPCVAFSIRRAVGPAVIRNRIRRQVRDEFLQLARNQPATVPDGSYLIVVRHAPATRDELMTWLHPALAQLQKP